MDSDTKTNREYKDSVFTLLFSEKDKLIELCNAFLDTNGSEVANMLLTEWKLEDALKVREEETREVVEKNLQKNLEKILAEQGVADAEKILKELRKSLSKD